MRGDIDDDVSRNALIARENLPNPHIDISLHWITFVNENLAGFRDEINRKESGPFGMRVLLVFLEIGNTHCAKQEPVRALHGMSCE